jgi:hypothetical protein
VKYYDSDNDGCINYVEYLTNILNKI